MMSRLASRINANLCQLSKRGYFAYNLDAVHPERTKRTRWLTADKAVTEVKSGI